MARAIRMTSEPREPAISEIAASRIAERPPAGGVANLLQPHPSHLSDLDDRGASLRRGAVRRPTLQITSAGCAGASFLDARPLVMRCRPLRPRRALCPLPPRGGAPAAGEFDPY